MLKFVHKVEILRYLSSKKRGKDTNLSPADCSEYGSVLCGVVDLLVEVLHGRLELVFVPRLYEHRFVLLDTVPDVVSLQQNNKIIESLKKTSCAQCKKPDAACFIWTGDTLPFAASPSPPRQHTTRAEYAAGVTPLAPRLFSFLK